MTQLVRRAICALSLIASVVPASAQDLTVWPNSQSRANSDTWLVQNHDRIRQMRPRLLVINFANGVNYDRAMQKVDQLRAALKESSRYHGHSDKGAPAFLDYQVEKYVDLTDTVPPAEKLDGNSTKYPRVPDWKEGINFAYGKLYGEEFAKHYNFKDPQTRKPLTLKELVDRGIVNEVWFLAYQGNFGAPLESVEVKQMYDESFQKLRGQSIPAGNGSAPDQPWIGRSLRILFINVERGPGCAMESLGHSLEWMARSNAVPYLKPYFEEYAGFDLDTRFALPFDSFYGRNGVELSYPDPTTLEFTWNGAKKTVRNYVPIGGNVHFMVNGRRDYDLDNTRPVMTTAEHYRMKDDNGRDKATLFTTAILEQYKTLGADCMGRWVIYWRQNMPGLNNKAKDAEGKPMKNWWPFLFY